MPVQIPDYSSDVFFYPWVGDNYANGWHLQGNKITCTGNNGDFCVMVVGEEGYCKPKYKQDRWQEEEIILSGTAYNVKQVNKCVSNCTHLFICKQKTINMILAHRRAKFDTPKQKKHGQWAQSQKTLSNFETEFYKNILKSPNTTNEIMGDERKQIWDYLSFFNFFQCGVNNTEESKNKSTRDNNEKNSYKAFINILERHLPHIVIILGENPQKVLKKYQPSSAKQQDNTILFSNQKFKSLLVFISHPSPCNRKLKEGEIADQILIAFQQATKYRNDKLL